MGENEYRTILAWVESVDRRLAGLEENINSHYKAERAGVVTEQHCKDQHDAVDARCEERHKGIDKRLNDVVDRRYFQGGVAVLVLVVAILGLYIKFA